MTKESILIIGAVLLWATDGLLRLPLLSNLTPLAIVFWEHAIALLVVVPIIFKNLIKLRQIKPAEWAGLVFIGLMASALATLAFTASFSHLNPSISILLIKLQPLFTFLLAAVWLKEKLPGFFWWWAGLAVLGGYWSAFSFTWPDFSNQSDSIWLGVLLALSAAIIWGTATVVGRYLVVRLENNLVTAWRFIIAWVTLAVWLLLSQGPAGFIWPSSLDLTRLSLIVIGPGLGAMLLYYWGLKRTPASLAAILELLWPTLAIVLNWYFLNQPLNFGQIVGAGLLLLAIGRLTVGPLFNKKLCTY